MQHMKSGPVLVLGIALLGSGLIILPLIATVWISLMVGVPGSGQYTAENYLRVFFDPFAYTVLWNTLRFALGSTIMALIVSAPLAWAFVRTDLPFRHVLAVLLGLILIIPGFLQAMGWSLMLSPRIGILNRLLVQIFGLEEAPFNIFSLAGMTFTQGLSLVPPAFFILVPVFTGMDSTLEEAAYLSGAGKLKTFLRINVRLAAPAMWAAAIYVFILAFALFEVPAVLGLPDRIFVFSTMLYFLVHVQQASLPEYGLAAAYGSIVIILSLVMALYYSRLFKQKHRFATITGKGRRATTLALGKWRPIVVGLVSLYFLLGLVMPLLAIIYYSLLLFYQPPSLDVFSSMTISNYLNLYSYQAIRPILNTGVLVALVPPAVILIAVPISWTVVRSRLRGRFALDNIAFLPLAVPRIVLAVSFLYLALWARNIIPLYGTIFLIALVHIVAFVSFATRTLNGALVQIHSDLEDAGRLSGASLSRVLRKITGPLLKPALFSAWFWVMLLSFRDVTMAVMLSSTDSIVFPAQIWILWNSGIPHQAAAAAVALTSTAAILMVVAHRLIQRLSMPGGY